jgi:formylglycine-generating enzyme required for sulfatase activity
MVFIPGGEFSRGRTYPFPDADVKWYPTAHKDDLPVRTIRIDPFYLDESEVTNERYAAFAAARGHRLPYHWVKGAIPTGKEKFPVTNVSWDDAQQYCQWANKRLPTEAEWERAARGNVTNAMYPWGDRKPAPADARFGSDSSVAVCSKARNDFGLCDMIGNVWEWCSDWYERTYYTNSPDSNPTGPEKGLYRVLRGGSFFDQPPLFLSHSYRSWARPAERSATIGFRCAADFPRTRGKSTERVARNIP